MVKKHNKAFSLVELSIVILIIGVLIAAVGQGLDLLQDARISAARMITQGSRANSIKDMQLWLDATSEKAFDPTEAQDSAQIGTWYDVNSQKTEKYNLVQTTQDKKPTYYQSAINGLPAVYFDGIDDMMSLASGVDSGMIFTRNNFTIFVVLIVPIGVTTYHASPNSAVLFEFVNDSGVRNLNIELNSVSTLRLDGGNNASPVTITGNTSVVTSAAKLFSGYRDANVPVLTSYINGAQYATAAAAGDDTAITNGKFDLGNHRVLQYNFRGYFGEIILYGRAISSKDRKSVETYLGKKWNIKVS